MSAYAVGAVLLVVVQAALITALFLSRSRAREAQTRNNALLRALPDLMFVQTRDGVYLDYSAKNAESLAAPPSRFLGRNMRDVLPAPLVERLFAALERLFNGEEPVLLEYDLQLPSGEVHWFEARLVRYEGDKFLSIVRDITEGKRASQALDRANADLLRASRMAALGEFAGSVAHELAQPLTAIIANSHACLRMLERPVVDWEEVRDGLHDVLQSGKLAREVIHSTRHLYRQGPLEKLPIDLPAIVNEVCVMVHSTIRSKHIALDVRFEPDLPPVRGDHVQLRQVILNLISNSIHAMEDLEPEMPRRLAIAVERDATGNARLTVVDSGIGLAHVDRSRLFTVSYTTKRDGMGWGLSISRSIVEAHGGRLWAETDVASGAVFCFTLPADSGDTHGTPVSVDAMRILDRERTSLT